MPIALSEFKNLRVALIHYWLVNHAGGERVLDALAEIFPQADVFTVVCKPSTLSTEIRRHKVTTSFLQHWPGSVRWYRHFLPLYPLALESFDLTAYDLVISQEAGPAKGVITRPDALHICYCNSPLRYLWDMHHAYRDTMNYVSRTVFSAVSNYLRMWDFSSAARVDSFIADSNFAAKRIQKYYRRDSTVIHPPVNVVGATVSHQVEDYYLMVGRLTDYKRVDLAMDVFNQLDRPLRIVGDGPLRRWLQRQARSNVQFLGRLPDEEIRQQYARCRALIFPGCEDFGIVPVEAQAFGRPVIAFGGGGALDTVIPYQAGITPAEFATGIHFQSQTREGLLAGVREFESQEQNFRPEFIHAHALHFRTQEFKRLVSEHVGACLEQRRPQVPSVLSSEITV